MDKLKAELNDLIDLYGLSHSKVIAFSQQLDIPIVQEQKKRLRAATQKR